MSEENRDDINLNEVEETVEEVAEATETVEENFNEVEETAKLDEVTPRIENEAAAPQVEKEVKKEQQGHSGLLTFCIILVIIAIIVVAAALIISSSMKKNGRVDQNASVIDAVSAFFKGEDNSKNTPVAKQDNTNSTVVIDADPNVTTGTDTTPAPTSAPVEVPTFNVTTTLGQYKGITVDYGDTTVTDEQLEMAIADFLDENAEPVEIADRAAQLGDTVLIDFSGKLDGVAFDGGTAEDQELDLGSGQMIPGFEEAIAGHNVGESFSFDITFPEEYGNADLAGKLTTFDINLKKITEYVTPELTDELVAENTDYATVEEYTEFLRQEALEENIAQADSDAEYEIYTSLINSCSFGGDIDAEIEYSKTQFMAQLDQMAEAYGATAELIAAYFYGMTLDQIGEQIGYSVKFSHVLDEIAIAENMTVSEEEFKTGFEDLFYNQYGFTDEASVYEQVSEEEAKNMVNRSVLSDKAEKFIMDNAVINK